MQQSGGLLPPTARRRRSLISRVPPGVPLVTSGGFSKLNMVDVAQLVSASDCGSEGRGFDSHHPPHKNRRYLRISPVFMGWMMGVERAKRKQSGGERTERRRWRNKRSERVAAVGRKQACFDRRSFCRAPQQDTSPPVGDSHVPSGTSPKNKIRLRKSGCHFYCAEHRKMLLTQI